MRARYLRRGEADRHDVRAALDALGIKRGEDFAIVRADDMADNAERLQFERSSSTSRQAGLDNWPRRGSQRQRMLAALLRNPYGRTADELAAELGLPTQTAGPRLLELRRGGWAQPTGATRRTRHGSEAKVYEATPRARDKARSAGD